MNIEERMQDYERKELIQDYERAVESGCFHGTYEAFREFRKIGCWGVTMMHKEDFSGFPPIPNELGDGVNGALGPLGYSSDSNFVVVPRECKYCKVRSFPTIEKAEHFVSENSRITDVEIITEREFVNAWNNRFYPVDRLY